MTMPPVAGALSAGDSPLYSAEHHRVTQELLAGQLRKAQEMVTAGLSHAMHQLSAQHENAVELLADRYNSPASFMPSPLAAFQSPSGGVLAVRPPPEPPLSNPERPQTRDQSNMPGVVVEEVLEFADPGREARRTTDSSEVMQLEDYGSGPNSGESLGYMHIRSVASDIHSMPDLVDEDRTLIGTEHIQDVVSAKSSSMLTPQGAWSTGPSMSRKASVRVKRSGAEAGSKNGNGVCPHGLHSRLLDIWTVQDGERVGPTDPRSLFKPDNRAGMLKKQQTKISEDIGDSATAAAWAQENSHGEGEKDVYKSKGCCAKLVIHPYNPGRSFWDVGSLFLVLYDMVMIPFNFFEPEESVGMVLMQWVTRVYWTLDMPLSFFSGFVTFQGSIELRPGKIARKYLRSWFVLDALVVGVDWFELLMAAAAEGLGFARFGKASRIFRILRMIRLLRLARMTEVLNLLTERLDSEKLVILIDVVKLVIIMLGAGHLIACVFYAVGAATDSDLAWLVQYTYNEHTTYKDAPLEFKYIMSLRWAISQFAGGMDEVTPVSFAENVYAVFIFFIAFWSGAVFVSILTSSMTQWYIIGSQQSQQLTVLRRYLSQNGISKKLALRVQRNAKHSLDEQQREMPEHAVGLINSVSEPLRVELHFEMYCGVLTTHPFFARYCEECPHVVRKICHQAMQVHQISMGDTIFNNGEKPDNPHMRILTRGKLTFSFKKEQVKVEAGTCISEAHLWVEWAHKGEMLACEDSRLHCLCAKEFQNLVSQFEHVGFEPRAYARLYVDCLNAIPEEELSDLPNTDMMHSFTMLMNTRAESSDNLDKLLADGEAHRNTIATIAKNVLDPISRRGSTDGMSDDPISETGRKIRQAFLLHMKTKKRYSSVANQNFHDGFHGERPSTILPMLPSLTEDTSRKSKIGSKETPRAIVMDSDDNENQSNESQSFLQPVVCN